MAWQMIERAVLATLPFAPGIASLVFPRVRPMPAPDLPTVAELPTGLASAGFPKRKQRDPLSPEGPNSTAS